MLNDRPGIMASIRNDELFNQLSESDQEMLIVSMLQYRVEHTLGNYKRSKKHRRLVGGLEDATHLTHCVHPFKVKFLESGYL